MTSKNTGGWKTCSRGHKFRGPVPVLFVIRDRGGKPRNPRVASESAAVSVVGNVSRALRASDAQLRIRGGTVRHRSPSDSIHASATQHGIKVL